MDGQSATGDAPYRYALVDGGYEITGSRRAYNRPLYGPHCRDRASFDERLLAIVGDSPEALLLLVNWRIPGGGGCASAKLGHLFLGFSGGKWFQECESVTSRYVPGRQDYELRDPTFDGAVRLTYVRPVDFEGLLARVRLPACRAGDVGDLVVAFGGPSDYAGGRHYDYQQKHSGDKDFHAEDCRGSEVRIEGNRFALRNPGVRHERSCFGTASGAFEPRLCGASGTCVASGRSPDWCELWAVPAPSPAGLLRTEPGEAPLVGGIVRPDPSAAPGEPREAFLLLTTDSLELPEILAFLADPATAFEACLKHYREVARTVRISTPDSHLDLGFEAQVLALDGAWHDPCFTHGTWSWTTPYAGWRICYGATVLGWHDRVRSQTREFFPLQPTEPIEPSLEWKRPGGFVQGHVCRGAIPDIAREKSFFYNMGEVWLDHALYDWEWTADLEFMREAFDHLAAKLEWEERLLDADGDGLYENWLNTWVSDAHWYNGGGCIQASVYNWRANAVMADVALRLGRDPTPFAERAARIKAACDSVLWVPEKGVYAEYADVLGRRMLHASPELASVYHPIDFRFTDELASYQMLRYTELAIPEERNSVPRGGRLVWSSGWKPVLYSSMGLYPQETINLLLCYYRLGLAERADELLRGIEASFSMGPCPGAVAHNQRPDGSHFGSTDFTDTSSMFLRTVVEGLFGLQMDAPHGRLTIQPAFPRDWGTASIDSSDASYEYRWHGSVEAVTVRTPRPLAVCLRLRARYTRVRRVELDGARCDFTVSPGVGCAWIVVKTPPTRAAEVRVSYGGGKLPELRYSPVAVVGEELRIELDRGAIEELRDPQGVLESPCLGKHGLRGIARLAAPGGRAACDADAELASRSRTLFVLAKKDDLRCWLPVDLELRPALEIVEPRIAVDGFRVRGSLIMRNNRSREVTLDGEVTLGGSRRFLQCSIPPLGASERLEIPVSHPARLSPGSNRLIARFPGEAAVEAEAVDWLLARRSALVRAAVAGARTVDLSPWVNQKLAELHALSYLAPRPATCSIMVKENGRSIWDWNSRGHGKAEPDTSRLHASPGLFESDSGVPFRIAGPGPDAVVVSQWENFPETVRIPVGMRGRKVYLLLAVSTNPMQSRIENGRVEVILAGGERSVLRLVNPRNIDDWLCEPFAGEGHFQPIGEKTHASVLDVDLVEAREIEAIELGCLANEVLIALVGLTVLGGEGEPG